MKSDGQENLLSKTGQLLVIDPGETVGWAWFSKDGDEIELVNHGQDSWRIFLSVFYAGCYHHNIKHILIENYRIRTSTIGANIGKELLTVKIIGIIEWIANRYCVNYEFQQPACQAKDFFTKKRLEEYGMWAVGKQHSRSAIRHGLYYYMFGEGKDGKS